MPWLLAGYMWLYIHRPFEVWPWLADLRIERVYMLVTLGCWFVAGNKGWVSNRQNVAFAGFFLAIVLSWLASPYREAGTTTIEDFAKVGVFYVLVMSCVRDERTLRFLIVAFLGCTALYMAHSLWEYRNGRLEYRMGTERMIGVDTSLGDPNSFAASLVYSLPLTIPFWHSIRSRRTTVLLLGYSAMAATCILLSGSRTGLMGLVVTGAFMVVLSRYRWRLALVAAALVPLIWFALPQDRQDRYLTLIDPSRGPTNAQESADTRKVFFKMAVELWKESPILAHGPDSFPIVSGTRMATHTLYGQILGEIGLVGAVAFLAVLACFALNGRDVARCYRGVPWNERGFPFWLAIGILVSVVLLLLLGLGGHNLYRFNWLWYGAFLAIAVRCARRQAFSARNYEDFNDESVAIDPYDSPAVLLQ